MPYAIGNRDYFAVSTCALSTLTPKRYSAMKQGGAISEGFTLGGNRLFLIAEASGRFCLGGLQQHRKRRRQPFPVAVRPYSLELQLAPQRRVAQVFCAKLLRFWREHRCVPSKRPGHSRALCPCAR